MSHKIGLIDWLIPTNHKRGTLEALLPLRVVDASWFSALLLCFLPITFLVFNGIELYFLLPTPFIEGDNVFKQDEGTVAVDALGMWWRQFKMLGGRHCHLFGEDGIVIVSRLSFFFVALCLGLSFWCLMSLLRGIYLGLFETGLWLAWLVGLFPENKTFWPDLSKKTEDLFSKERWVCIAGRRLGNGLAFFPGIVIFLIVSNLYHTGFLLKRALGQLEPTTFDTRNHFFTKPEFFYQGGIYKVLIVLSVGVAFIIWRLCEVGKHFVRGVLRFHTHASNSEKNLVSYLNVLVLDLMLIMIFFSFSPDMSALSVSILFVTLLLIMLLACCLIGYYGIMVIRELASDDQAQSVGQGADPYITPLEQVGQVNNPSDNRLQSTEASENSQENQNNL